MQPTTRVRLLLFRILLSLSVLATQSSAASGRPLTPLDLVSIPRVGGVVPSPDGHLAAFTVSTYNATDNTGTRNLWLLDLATNAHFPVTFADVKHKDSSPVWFSDRILGFLSSRSGSSQLWFIDVSRASADNVPEAAQLTKYPIDIANPKYRGAPANILAFTATVYEDGSLETAAQKNAQSALTFSTGAVFDSLFVRHWDTYATPGQWEQLFLASLTCANGVPTLGPHRNVMAGTRMETPVKPFGGEEQFDVAPDGKWVAFEARPDDGKQAWSTNTDIYLVPLPADLSSATPLPSPKSVTMANKGYDTNPVFSPDSGSIAYLSMLTPGFEADRTRLSLYSLSTTTTSVITEDWDRSVSSAAWSADGKSVYVTAEDVARGKVFRVDVEKGVVEELTREGSASSLSVLPTSTPSTPPTLLFTHASSHAPPEVHTLSPGSNVPDRRTTVTAAHVAPVRMEKMSEFWFQGGWCEEQAGEKGEKECDVVHAVVWKPYGWDAVQNVGRKWPVAFLIHGGPQGAWSDSWSTRWNPQIFSSAGYFVVAVNPTGSTGYGQKFTDGVSKHWGGRTYRDLMKGVDALVERWGGEERPKEVVERTGAGQKVVPERESVRIDKERIGALGASYGGYMINWINGHTNRFKCLVNHDGILNTVAAYYGTEELWFPEWEFGGKPWEPEARKLYEKWNPEHYVDRWETPTLVIHSAKDFRLPLTEGLGTFTALQRRGIESKLLYFPDENHWVLKPANSLKWHGEVLAWLEKHLKE